MRHGITNEFDYLIAKAERETEHARKILAEAREANDYWQEKAAAKLAAFCESQERLMRLYAELRLYHPDMADALVRRWPSFKTLEDTIKREYEEFRGTHE